MSEHIFTFWEGSMPEYIKLCMATWKFPYTVLNYANLSQYTELNLQNKDKFTLPQIADCVRVHVLRDNGGCWLDADTILFGDQLPDFPILGYNEKRSNTIGYLKTTANSDMYIKWAEFQDNILNQENPSTEWNVFGNAFTDPYLKEHTEIPIGNIEDYWAELDIKGNIPRRDKYKKFYFECQLGTYVIKTKKMLMLHNSWTPKWYKQLSRTEVLSQNCTLSNILREVTAL